uniref:ArfGAP with FG repeats 2 n=1 Tax=Pipistrellus kuhlii TaxID=59472 RepID=A0A7J7YV92_PIPKU|nr:ArfGAP with FG repeats 2 [Pipistrellus kuhlii]
MRRRDGMSPQIKSRGPLTPKAAPLPLSRAPSRKGSLCGHFWGILCHLFPLMPPPLASLLASLGCLSPGAPSRLPTPRSRKPVPTCWLTLVETPLLLPRQHHHLLHSQPLGVRQTPSHGGFANFDAFGSSPSSSAFGSIPLARQTPFQAQPAATGSSQVTPFGASPLAPASQPNSLPDMSGLLGPGASAGGLPSSIFGMTSQVPTLQSAPTGGGGGAGLAFGAFTNPFTAPAAHPPLPSTNPFQPNGLATGPGFGMSSAGPGFSQAVPPPGPFASTFPPPMFSLQTSMTQQQNGSSFSDLGPAKLEQRPLSQPAGISTNPFMTGSSSSPFASKPPTTNPFL